MKVCSKCKLVFDDASSTCKKCGQALKPDSGGPTRPDIPAIKDVQTSKPPMAQPPVQPKASIQTAKTVQIPREPPPLPFDEELVRGRPAAPLPATGRNGRPTHARMPPSPKQKRLQILLWLGIASAATVVVVELVLLILNLNRPQPQPMSPPVVADVVQLPATSPMPQPTPVAVPASPPPAVQGTAQLQEDPDLLREQAMPKWKACQKSYYAMDLIAAKKTCNEALEIAPDFVDARIGLGWVLFEAGENDQALAAAREAKGAATKDDERAYASVLEAAILTVQGLNEAALGAIETAVTLNYKGKEAKARKAMLQGQPIPDHWVKHVLPRYACWRKKGMEPATSYLQRRGIMSLDAFEQAVEALEPEIKSELNDSGLQKCPW